MAAPVVQNQRPVNGDTLVAPYQPAYLEITDADADLTAASVVIKHNGLVAWSGDAAQPGFSVTKTVITNGFSYSVLPDILPERGSKVSINIYAVDTASNSVVEDYTFEIGTSEYLLRWDDFDDATLDPDLVIPAGNGIVTEPAGTMLKLDCPNSLTCPWWNASKLAPRPYYPFAAWMGRKGVFQVESRLAQYDESVNGLSYGGGPFLYIDDQNMIEIGYYLHTSYRDVRVHRGVANTFTNRYETGALTPPNTTPHRYRIIWNASGAAFKLADDSFLQDGYITFYYSVNDGANWTRAYTEAMALDTDALVGFGTMLRKDPSGVGDNAQAYVDYLELRELVPEDSGTFTDDGQVEIDARRLDLGGPPIHGDGFGIGQQIAGSLMSPVGHSPVDDGQLEVGVAGKLVDSRFDPDILLLDAYPLRDAQVEIEATYVLSLLTDYRRDTNDFNGHPHFISDRIFYAFFYDAAKEAGPWTTPTDPSFTGYGKDGHYYVGGVDQLTFAPWYNETESDNRGPRQDFPDKALICVGFNGSGPTPSEVVIFDLDSFPVTLNVWMRFTFGPSGGNYTMMGRVNQLPTDVAMANGIMSVVTTEGDYRGALHMINFTQPGKDCGHYIRSDNHLVWQPANGIADRNLTGASQWTTSGVTISLRTDEEQLHSVAMLADGATTLVAIGGEDPGPNVYKLTTKPISRIQATGNVGAANIGDKRKVTFDEDGQLWIALDNRIHRILAYDLGEELIDMQTDLPNTRIGAAPSWVALPYTILDFAAVGDFLFVGTEVGVYRVHRGSLEYALAYTIVGGGGGGSTDTPPAGELIPGDEPEVRNITGNPLHSAHYLHVRTNAAAATIRTLDDLAVDSRTFPDLDAPFVHFNVVLVK